MKYLLILSYVSLGFVFYSCQFDTSAKEINENKEGEKNKKHPNIIFISIDDLRPELGCYGNQEIHTPYLDHFAEEANLFTNAYCQAAVCAPSRASLMTGLRPDSTKVWHLGDEFRQTIPDVVTMPQYFSDYGYYTVSIGKIFHNYMPDSVSWDEPDLKPFPFNKPEYANRDAETFYHNEISQQRQKERRDEIVSKQPAGKKIYADGWYSGPAYEVVDLPDSLLYDGMQVDLAIETMNRIKDKEEPFFLALGFFRPHLPFVAPKKYWDMYPPGTLTPAKNQFLPENAPVMSENANYELRNYLDYHHVNRPSGTPLSPEEADILRRGYYASVSYVDACMGKLIDYLKKADLYDNSIIMIWGDHGWKLGEHNGWGKQTNFEIDTRVPLIYKAPWQKEGKRITSLIELVDMFPTLCDLAGIEIASYLQGQSLVPLVNDPQIEWKDAVFSQFRRRARISGDGQEYMGYSMRTQRYHYIEWYKWDNENRKKGDFAAVELYDHSIDPDENVNIATKKEHADLLKELSKKLWEGWQKSLKGSGS